MQGLYFVWWNLTLCIPTPSNPVCISPLKVCASHAFSFKESGFWEEHCNLHFTVHFKSLEMYFSSSLQIVAPKSGSYSGRFRWDILFSQTVSSALQSVGNRRGNVGWVVRGYHFMTSQEPHRSFKVTWAHVPAFQPDPCKQLWLEPFTSLCLDLTICNVICAFLFRGTNEMI